MRTAADGRTAPPKQEGLSIEGWDSTYRPTLNGTPLPLDAYEISRSLALHPDGDRFVLGTEWSLRAFDAKGNALWRQDVPGVVWAVNVTGDGRLVVAAYGDGTIRWHRMDDGREILAFMPLADRTNWVAWTPEGFYAASPGAHGVLRWHVNQPDWQPAKDYAVADIPGFYRPEAIKLVLQEMETPRAIGLAVMAEQRRKVQLLTNSRVPPGAKLHVLAIGVSHYNEQHGAHLRLKFAQKDAQDVIAALGSTQDGLYVAGSRQYLADEDATRGTILRGLATLRAAMTSRDDLAVVQFSGHGAMVDGELYLLPQNVDARDAVDDTRHRATGCSSCGRSCCASPPPAACWCCSMPATPAARRSTAVRRMSPRLCSARRWRPPTSPSSPRPAPRRLRARTPAGRTAPSPRRCWRRWAATTPTRTRMGCSARRSWRATSTGAFAI